MALKPKKNVLPPAIDETNIDQVEKEIMASVNKTISSIEKVLATWDLLLEKPEDLKDKIKRYKWLHDELCKWEKEMLTTKKKDFQSRVERVWKFIDICTAYGGG